METDCNPMELSSMSGFDENTEINGFEGTDVKDMRLEAEAVVSDVLFAVNTMFVSKTLRCADDVAYINVETRERNRYCLELTEAGLKVSERLPLCGRRTGLCLCRLVGAGAGPGKSVEWELSTQ